MKNKNRKYIIFLLILIIGSLNLSGCIDYESDFEYKFYYYIDIQSSESGQYELYLPIPYDIEIVDDIKLRTGNGTYEIEKVNNEKYLHIISNGNFSVYSEHKTWDNFLDYELRERTQYSYYKNGVNLSVVLESKALKIWTTEEYWELFYSSMFDGNINNMNYTKESWNKHLIDEYSIELNNGWHTYYPQEGVIKIY